MPTTDPARSGAIVGVGNVVHERGEGLRFGVALLAAGASKRMGRPKLLLPWRATTILGHLVDQWQSLGAKPTAVVFAPGNRPIEDELERLGVPAKSRIPNPHPEEGMFSSIRRAAAWTGWEEASTHVVFALADQPQVGRETLQGFLDFAAANPEVICQPELKGRGRHPVAFPRRLLPVLTATPAPTLKEFLIPLRSKIARWLCHDPTLDWDIDEPADYERALKSTGQA